MDKRIIVGQKIYLEPMGNFARRNPSVVEATITDVKRKYFYVKIDTLSFSHEKFDIETCKYADKDYCNGSWVVWFSMDEYNKDVEKKQMIKEIREIFNHNGSACDLSYHLIKTIHGIATINNVTDVEDK